MSELDFLYEENILEHFRNPKNKRGDSHDLMEDNIGKCEDHVCNYSAEADNFDCGDNLKLFIFLDEKDKDKIKEIFWTGSGCALSQAGMSMMTEKIKKENLSVEDLKSWTPAKIYELLKINISPSRVNCALLSYHALENFLKEIK